MDNQQATDVEIGWLAGIVDGEGWIGFSIETEHWYRAGYNTRQKSVKVEFRINNTDEAIIDRAQEIIRKLGVNPYRRSSKHKNSKHRLIHEVATKRMAPLEKILSVLEPHLVGNKQLRSKLIRQFIKCRKENPGIPNPAYENYQGGRLGPRTIRPYSSQEVKLIESCRKLQQTGASETSRETRNQALDALKESVEAVKNGDFDYDLTL